MLDTSTEKNLKKIVKLAPELFNYRKIMDNCTQYMVKPNGNKFWLYNNWIVAEWKDCQHSNPFESWKFPNAKTAREYFESMSFDNNW